MLKNVCLTFGHIECFGINCFMKIKFTFFLLIILHTIVISVENIPTTLVFPPYMHTYGIRKAGNAKLFMFLPFTKFKDPRGIAITKMISRDDTTTKHDDDEVTVYGVNGGNNNIIYNTSMYGLTKWGKKGSGKNQMDSAVGIVCDPKGWIFIADAGNDRIIKLFNPQKKVEFKEHLGLGILKRPTHLAVDGKQNIYISNTGNNEIIVMNYNGKVLKTIKQTNKINIQSPRGIAVSFDNEGKYVFYKRDYIYFVDSLGKRLNRIDNRNNNSISVYSDSIIKGAKYEYICTDYYGNVYCTDRNRSCVDKYNLNLEFLTTFGDSGKGDRQFEEPRGICMWKRYGQTIIAEKLGAQYYWVGTDANILSIKDMGAEIHIKTFLYEAAYGELKLMLNKDTIAILPPKPKRKFNAGNATFIFKKDFKNISKNHHFLFQIEPTYSSRTYFKKDFILNSSFLLHP